jgi:hypothetical protein
VVIEGGFAEFALGLGRHDIPWLTAFTDNDNDIITSTACAEEL